MNYNKERHKELVIRWQNLKSQGKILCLECPKEDAELSKYNIEVEEQVFWAHRNEFLLLMKNFINNIINFDKFETDFTLLYRKITKKVDIFITDLEQIEKFQPSTRLYRFASFMASIFRQFEEVEDQYCTKQELKNSVEKIYLKIQNSLTKE